MIIDFHSIPFETLPNFKDGNGAFEVQMFFDGNMRIMHGKLAQGSSIGLHRHEGNCEVLFVVKGEGVLIDGEEKQTITAGQCTYCPEGQAHSLINENCTELEFYAVVPKQ